MYFICYQNSVAVKVVHTNWWKLSNRHLWNTFNLILLSDIPEIITSRLDNRFSFLERQCRRDDMCPQKPMQVQSNIITTSSLDQTILTHGRIQCPCPTQRTIVVITHIFNKIPNHARSVKVCAHWSRMYCHCLNMVQIVVYKKEHCLRDIPPTVAYYVIENAKFQSVLLDWRDCEPSRRQCCVWSLIGTCKCNRIDFSGVGLLIETRLPTL